MAKAGQIDALALRAQGEMDASTTRMAKILKPELSGDDASNVPTDQWHTMIRDNWNSPQWRAAQARQRGDVSLAQDACKAFGVDPKLIGQPEGTPMPAPEM